MKRRLAVLWCALAALAGCGFRLQGSMPLPKSLSSVHIVAVDTQSQFYFGLRKALRAAGTRLDDAGSDPAATVLRISTDDTAERVLTVSNLNIPNEYELTYTMRFSVEAQGRELIAAEQHVLVRDYSYSESAQLAKERERELFSEALANDLVSVVMRRLASL